MGYMQVIVQILLVLCYNNSDDPYDEDFQWEQMEFIYKQYDIREIHSVLKEFHFLKNDLHTFLDLSKEYLEDEISFPCRKGSCIPADMLFVNSSYITGMFRRKRMGY